MEPFDIEVYESNYIYTADKIQRHGQVPSLRQGFFVSLKNLVNFAKKNKNMTRILLTLSLICLIMTGCSNSNEPIEFEDETQTIDLAEYEEVVYKNRELFI